MAPNWGRSSWLPLFWVALAHLAAPARCQLLPLPPPVARNLDLSPPLRKIQPVVLDTIASLQQSSVQPSGGTGRGSTSRFSTPFVRVDDRGRVQLYLELYEITPERLSALASEAQVEIELVNGELRLVQAWVPFDQLEKVAVLDFVKRIRPPDYADYFTGSTTSQGDAVLKADVVRNTLALTGAGVKIGVISDGANDASLAQESGDLPASIQVFGDCNFQTSGLSCNEGTALMEIIYDLAPGVTLAMGAVTTSLEFIQRVSSLTLWGARVIVNDAGFFDEPYFEDGPLALAFAQAAANGVVMVSAAGNFAQNHYQAMFADATGYHDFGFGDTIMSFALTSGRITRIFLQWSSPFGAAADDYELCALADDGVTLIACSGNPQTGTQDPIESLALICLSFQTCRGNLRIEKKSGEPRMLEMFIAGSILTQNLVTADSVFGIPAAPGVISVGAIRASDPGNQLIELDSSRGPSTILLPSMVQRPTPTLTAVDCVAVTGAGGFPRNFCGTSAASAHVAAIAALLLEAKPGLSAAQVRNLLESTAAERGAAGYDHTYGSGLVDALEAALAVLGNPMPSVASLEPSSAVRGSPDFELTVHGSDFVSGSVVRWNDSERPTTFVSANELTALIAAADLAAPGTAQITVISPGPGGGSSEAVSFFINNPIPAMISLSPSSAVAGASAFALTAHGSGFIAGTVIRWNGSDRPTTVVSDTELTALISAGDIAASGTVQVTVFNPAPGGGNSNPLPFSITDSSLPFITAAGLVNGASFGGPPPAAGAIASLFGVNLAAEERSAPSLPLLTSLGGTTLRLNDIAVPLFYVRADQINFMVPWDLLGQPVATLTVSTALGTSAPVAINLSPLAPGIFTTNSQGTGQGAILISNTADLAAPAGSIPGRSARPVPRGQYITIYCTGLGEVNDPPPSGSAAGSNPLSRTSVEPTVTIGGEPATVAFSGLAPGFVGLYQIDVLIPQNAPPGQAVEVVVRIGGVTANSVTIAVQ